MVDDGEGLLLRGGDAAGHECLLRGASGWYVVSMLSAWKHRMPESGHAEVQAEEDVAATLRVRDIEKRVRDLEWLLGRRMMEDEIVERHSTLLARITDIALAVQEQSERRLTVSALARTLNVARSQIDEGRGRTVTLRGPYSVAEDAEFLAPIRAVFDSRLSYG